MYRLESALMFSNIHAIFTSIDLYSTIKTRKEPIDFPFMKSLQIRSRGLPYVFSAHTEVASTTLGIKRTNKPFHLHIGCCFNFKDSSKINPSNPRDASPSISFHREQEASYANIWIIPETTSNFWYATSTDNRSRSQLKIEECNGKERGCPLNNSCRKATSFRHAAEDSS